MWERNATQPALVEREEPQPNGEAGMHALIERGGGHLGADTTKQSVIMPKPTTTQAGGNSAQLALEPGAFIPNCS